MGSSYVCGGPVSQSVISEDACHGVEKGVKERDTDREYTLESSAGVLLGRRILRVAPSDVVLSCRDGRI